MDPQYLACGAVLAVITVLIIGIIVTSRRAKKATMAAGGQRARVDYDPEDFTMPEVPEISVTKPAAQDVDSPEAIGDVWGSHLTQEIGDPDAIPSVHRNSSQVPPVSRIHQGNSEISYGAFEK